MLGWPLIAPDAQAVDWQTQATPFLSSLLLPVIVAIIINDLVAADFGPRLTAVIAALIALGVALRLVSPGAGGIEPIWLVVLLAGRALGAAAGFSVGAGAIALSAVATGGVGPWLPFQMMAAGWVGLGAGLLPRLRGRAEVGFLAGYGFASGIAFGWVMNLWFWPSAIGLQSGLAFDPTADFGARVAGLIRFSLTTSLGFDLPRAAVSALLIMLVGRRLLAVIRRVAVPSVTVPAA